MICAYSEIHQFPVSWRENGCEQGVLKLRLAQLIT